MSMRLAASGGLIACFALLMTVSDALAQNTRWHVTAGLSTGGFASDLYTGPITTQVNFPEIGAGLSETVTITEPYGFDSFVGMSGGVEWRRDHLGVWGSVSWLPTRARAIETEGQVTAQLARALGFPVDPSRAFDEPSDVPVPIRLKTPQNLVIPTVGVTYYSAAVPAPGRSSPPVEYYVSGGVGIVQYLDDDPLLVNAGDALSDAPADAETEWDTPVMGTLGAGMFINVTGSYGLRVEVMGGFWQTEIWGESQTQTAFMFRPAFVLIL